MNNTIPNFFIVGAPKTGSTSLYNYLNQHPEIFMPKIKEPHHFCKDFIKEGYNFHKFKYNFTQVTASDRKDYLNLFSEVKNEKAVGEASVGYLRSKVAAKEIRKFNPKAKIIIMLREPTELLFSLYLHKSYSGNETAKSFEKALELEKERKKNNKGIPKGNRWPSDLYYSEKIRFASQIKRYLKEFPKNQIKIIIFDDFKKDNNKIYQETAEFLNVNPSFKPNFKIINKYKTHRINFKHKNKIKLFIAKYFPLKIKNLICKCYLALNTIEPEKPKLDPILKIKLKKKYKNEVVLLSKLLNRDLVKLWEYDKIY